MKIAVTAREPSVDSFVDQRFGRARYILVVNTDTGRSEPHDNEVNLNSTQGAGIQTAGNVAALGVGAVLTGHVGPNAFRVLTAAGIDVYAGLEGTVDRVVGEFIDGKLARLESADVEGHW